VFDEGYVNTGGTFVQFLPDTHILMMSKESSPFWVYEGLSADEDAPKNHTGKFAKTWTTKDPSGMFILLEYNFMPVIERVDQIVYAQITTS
jgi:hypothetical protein